MSGSWGLIKGTGVMGAPALSSAPLRASQPPSQPQSHPTRPGRVERVAPTPAEPAPAELPPLPSYKDRKLAAAIKN